MAPNSNNNSNSNLSSTSNNNIFHPESPSTAQKVARLEKSDSVGDVDIYGSTSPKIDRYEGVIVTTYQLYFSGTRTKVANYNTLKGDERVFIRERGAEHGPNAVFLKDLSRDTDPNGDTEYFGTFLTVEQAAKEIKDKANGRTPLFCVHGNTTEVGNWMYSVDAARWNDSKHYGVPVCWPLYSAGVPNYTYGQNRNDHAPPSGKTLASFVNEIPNHIFPKKSLMMHSMGAHVVLNWACRNETPDVKFENLFFVAADVPYDVFQNNPFESYGNPNQRHQFGNKTKKANNLAGMLARDSAGKPIGKIVVLYSWLDTAAGLSNTLNGDHNRLAKVGPFGYRIRPWWFGGQWEENNIPFRDENRLRPEFRGYVDDHLCNDISAPTELRHMYQFSDETLDIYKRYHLEDTQW